MIGENNSVKTYMKLIKLSNFLNIVIHLLAQMEKNTGKLSVASIQKKKSWLE